MIGKPSSFGKIPESTFQLFYPVFNSMVFTELIDEELRLFLSHKHKCWVNFAMLNLWVIANIPTFHIASATEAAD